MACPSPAPVYQKEIRPSDRTAFKSVPVTLAWQAVQWLSARSWAGVLASEAQPAASSKRATAVSRSANRPRRRSIFTRIPSSRETTPS
jgi:hypothetical protein